jgi:hypothetical protein
MMVAYSSKMFGTSQSDSEEYNFLGCGGIYSDHTTCLLLFGPENGSCTVLQNVKLLPDIQSHIPEGNNLYSRLPVSPLSSWHGTCSGCRWRWPPDMEGNYEYLE